MLVGHDRTGTTVWLALTLWVIMAVGEAALLAQSSMAIAVWCALFGLPSLYLQCRHILDVLVEEALQLVAAFLRAGELPILYCLHLRLSDGKVVIAGRKLPSSDSGFALAMLAKGCPAAVRLSSQLNADCLEIGCA